MNNSAEDVKDILEADSDLALVFATNLFIGNEPTTPKDCVTIFDTPGFAPQLTLDTSSIGYEYPSVQIRVRSINYNTGWALIEGIKTLLHGLNQETWNSTLYSHIACSSGPALLDRDDNGLFRFFVNFNINRRNA